MAKITLIHWAGGVRHAHGTWLPGWPCCCSGDRAERIAAAGNQSRCPSEVTCRRCLATMRRDVDFARRFRHEECFAEEIAAMKEQP